MLQQDSTAGCCCHCHLWGSEALDGCFGAENTDSATFLAAFGVGACAEPGCAVFTQSRMQQEFIPRDALVLRGWAMPEGGGIPPLLLLQEEQSSSLSDTYLLSFSLITCQQGDDCLDFLAILLFSPTQQKPE